MILPLTQSDSTRPVYDAAGKIVSFTQHSEMIVRALNLVHELANSNPLSAMAAFSQFSRKAQEIVRVK